MQVSRALWDWFHLLIYSSLNPFFSLHVLSLLAWRQVDPSIIVIWKIMAGPWTLKLGLIVMIISLCCAWPFMLYLYMLQLWCMRFLSACLKFGWYFLWCCPLWLHNSPVWFPDPHLTPHLPVSHLFSASLINPPPSVGCYGNRKMPVGWFSIWHSEINYHSFTDCAIWMPLQVRSCQAWKWKYIARCAFLEPCIFSNYVWCQPLAICLLSGGLILWRIKKLFQSGIVWYCH